MPPSHPKQRSHLRSWEIDLEGPKAGEVLIKATEICHTDSYTLDGFDSEGSFGQYLATKAQAWCTKSTPA